MPTSPVLARFGLFELDLRTGELSKSGRRRRLQEQPFRLLRLLLEHPGHAVTRERLRNALWPADTFVDFDHGLNTAVAKLRQVLGDSAENPRFIETMSRYGYKFIAPVEFSDRIITSPGRAVGSPVDCATSLVPGPEQFECLEATDCQPENVSQEGLPVHRLGHQEGRSVYAYKTELDAWWESRKVQDEPPEVPQEESPPPFSENLVGVQDSTVRPDGAAQAVSAARPVHTRFWMWLLAAVAVILAAIYVVQHIPSRAAGSLTVTPLTAYPGKEVQPSLSPDGNHVAFAFNRGRTSNYDIYVKVIGSEEITRLTSDPADDLSPSWSPDGQNIVFLRFVSDQSALVMVVPSAGGAERQLAKLQIERNQTEIRVAWSPDGEWIATSDEETSLSPMRLVLISSRTGRKRRLNYQPPTADSDLSPSFSPDGRYLAYARHISPVVADIYVLEVPKEGGPAIEARPLTHWNRMNRSPVWSGDGKEVFFVGDESRIGPRIWRVPAFTRGDARRINQIGEASTSIALSLSGNRLVYSKEIEDWNIWRLDLTPASGVRAKSQASAFRVIASTYEDGQPQYSPDGKYIAFQSDRSGDPEIWIVSFR